MNIVNNVEKSEAQTSSEPVKNWNWIMFFIMVLVFSPMSKPGASASGIVADSTLVFLTFFVPFIFHRVVRMIKWPKTFETRCFWVGFALVITSIILYGFAGGADSMLSERHKAEAPSPAATAYVQPVVKQYEHAPEYVDIKYGNQVDIADDRFDTVDTSKSSFIRGAWYDESEEYLILNLNEIYYEYCEVPEDVWYDFKYADSFGREFNNYIKEEYPC